jgi:hypothetical protein
MADVLIKPKDVSSEQWSKATQLYNTAKNRGDRHPELTLAQAILETGWFKSPAGKYNYFGQKATASQKGSNKSTLEVSNNKAYRTNAKFRDYDTLEEAVDDRIKKWGSKYKNAETIDEALGKIWKYNPRTGSGEGYATDDKYDVKIKSILGKMGISTNKSNPENSNYPSSTEYKENYYQSSPEEKDYYLDSTLNLTQDSGDYITAPDYYETDKSSEDEQGDSAKNELRQAQQEKNFLQEIQAKQEQQQNPQTNQSGYELYMPELPEYQTQQAQSYFENGGTQGGFDYEAFRKELKRFDEGGDFAETYAEEENPFGAAPKTFQEQIAQGYTVPKQPTVKKPVKKSQTTSKVDELISKYGVKPGQNIKIDERALRVKPFTGVREGASNVQEQVLEKKQELKYGSKQDILRKIEENKNKSILSEINKELSNKATLEDAIENRDIDLKLSDFKNRDQVKKLQSFLVEKGYNLNPEGKFENSGIDGKAGKVTLKAIQQYNQNLSNSGYSSIKEGNGLLGKCTESQCSEYSQNELFRNLQPNVSREEWNAKTGIMGDAWNIGKNIISKGGQEVKPKQVQPGDVITVYTHGISPFQKEADAAGTGTTHVGIVDKVNPDGSYYILHNLHKGSKEEGFEGREYRDLVKANEIQGHSSPYTVKHIFRPNYGAVENGEKKIVREDLAIKLNPKKAAILSTGDYDNFFTSASAKSKLENSFIKPLNDKKNKKVISKVFNLGDDEYNSLAKASLGILGQESAFGTNQNYTTGFKQVKANGAKVLGTLLGKEGTNLVNSTPLGKIAKRDEVSKGAGQLKYETNFGKDDVTELGITKDNFSEEDKVSLTTMYKLSKDYKKFLDKGFSKKDAIYRAITTYNSTMGRVVNGKKIEDWAKDYDVDYTNKVLNYSNMFDVSDTKKSYKTTSDSLLLQKNVAKWRASLKDQKKI